MCEWGKFEGLRAPFPMFLYMYLLELVRFSRCVFPFLVRSLPIEYVFYSRLLSTFEFVLVASPCFYFCAFLVVVLIFFILLYAPRDDGFGEGFQKGREDSAEDRFLFFSCRMFAYPLTTPLFGRYIFLTLLLLLSHAPSAPCEVPLLCPYNFSFRSPKER